MSITQNFRELGFPIPFVYRRGIDYTAYQISTFNVAKGNEAIVSFALGGLSWPASVITGTAYYEEKDGFREYVWIERKLNEDLPWPPDRNLFGGNGAVLKPAPMDIPYGLDVNVKPIPVNCEGKNFAVPFVWTGGSYNDNQCLWQIARSDDGIKLKNDVDSFTTLSRLRNEPIPLSISGEWVKVWSQQYNHSNEWFRRDGTVSASNRWRIVRFFFITQNSPPSNPVPISDVFKRKIRVGYSIGSGDIIWDEKNLPDAYPVVVEFRLMIPPSTEDIKLYADALIPDRPENANVQSIFNLTEIVNVGRTVLWHDREIFTVVGSDSQPTVNMKGKDTRVPIGSNIVGDGLVFAPPSWKLSDGFDTQGSSDPIWIIADILTRSVYDYEDDAINWDSFLEAGEQNTTNINRSISIQTGPLETIAPVLGETGLTIFQKKGVWEFRTGLRLLIGSRQIIGVPSIQTPTVRIPTKVSYSWGEFGYDELTRKYQDKPTVGEDIIPWKQDLPEAQKDAREQLWPRENVIMNMTIGPMGSVLEVGDIIAVDISAPAVKEYELQDDGSYILTLSDPLPSTNRRVRFMTDVEEVSGAVSVEPLLNGKLKARGFIQSKAPTLRAAIVNSNTQEWEVLSVSKSSSIEYNISLLKTDSQDRINWINFGRDGCERIQEWTRSILDWPQIDSCGGFSL